MEGKEGPRKMIENYDEERKLFWKWFYAKESERNKELFKLSCQFGQYEAVEIMFNAFLEGKQEAKIMENSDEG
jgi:hypothetical protein